MSSLSAAFVMLLMRGVQIISPGFSIFLIFFAIEDLSFYTLLGSYVGSAILLYLATVRPVFYSLRVSVRTVYGCAAANVIGSIVISVLAAVFQAAEQSQGPYRCGEHCKHVIIIVMDSDITKCSNFYQADHLIYPAIMSSFQTLAWSPYSVSGSIFPIRLELLPQN
ncbi:hypothetical protein CAEBREN_16615 [Caenorhabditis brenneri]|uniref:Uncharacterized protein n=1 Tax=Caenorhabditis brenneri TaxID=135651 RepID=G0MPE5_CAEBE|nr:hypothetical protein CAEBREN_16615 [Caenorhabditis brenneri]